MPKRLSKYGSVSLDSIDSLMILRTKWKNKFLKRHPAEPDDVDVGLTRDTGSGKDVKPLRASILDSFFSLLSIGTYTADIVTDGLVSAQYFINGDFWWFGFTAAFIIFPSIVMQIFSCKWYKEDNIQQRWYSYILHILQLGPIERFVAAFWFGLKTRWNEKVNVDHYLRYLSEWRDITMLRLVEGFLEAAPQMILQLYVLASRNEFIVGRDWLTALSAVCSIISLAWAIVSYSHSLRLCLSNKGLSLCGYIFQIWYRLLMVSSRVIAMVLFASALKAWVFVFVCIHCTLMALWLSFHQTNFCADETGIPHKCLEKLFHLIIAFVYLFCFINIEQGATRDRISLYYLIFFIENCFLMGFWYPYKTIQGWLVFASFGVVFGGFIFGIICMLFYYQFFHPNQDITEGWICCECCQWKSDHENNPRESVKAASVAYEIVSNGPTTTTSSESPLLNKGKCGLDVSHLLFPQGSPGPSIEVEIPFRLRSSLPHIPSLIMKNKDDENLVNCEKSLQSTQKLSTYTTSSNTEKCDTNMIDIDFKPERTIDEKMQIVSMSQSKSNCSLPAINCMPLADSASLTNSQLCKSLTFQNFNAHMEPHYHSPPKETRLLHCNQSKTLVSPNCSVNNDLDENNFELGNVAFRQSDTVSKENIRTFKSKPKQSGTFISQNNELRNEHQFEPRNLKFQRQISLSENNLVHLTKKENNAKLYRRLLLKDDTYVDNNRKLQFSKSGPECDFLRRNMASLVTNRLKTSIKPIINNNQCIMCKLNSKKEF